MESRLSPRILAPLLLAWPVHAGVVILAPSQDCTLYESLSGNLGNGQGDHLFAGVTAAAGTRRTLVQFDVAGQVPAGATILSAELQFQVTRTITAAVDMDLRRVERAWGEGASFGGGAGEGQGGPAATGDATWQHAQFPSVFWTTDGGDLAAVVSATTSVSTGAVSISSAGTAADVQAWLDAPASNFGWALLASNESLLLTSKRFGSRENGNAPDRPRLVIDYSTGGTGTSFCSSLPNATGSPALLTATGAPNGSLVFTSAPVPETTGQFFFGPMMLAGSPFGDGLLCAGGMTQRLLPFVTAGMMMQPANTAIFTVNYTAPYASGLTGTQYFQHWFRSGLPGAGFNTSDGLEITF